MKPALSSAASARPARSGLASMSGQRRRVWLHFFAWQFFIEPRHLADDEEDRPFEARMGDLNGDLIQRRTKPALAFQRSVAHGDRWRVWAAARCDQALAGKRDVRKAHIDDKRRPRVAEPAPVEVEI